LTHLNKAQKDALKAQVTSAQRVANVTSIQQTANELNTVLLTHLFVLYLS
jgi:tryptophan synthase alpha subunit